MQLTGKRAGLRNAGGIILPPNLDELKRIEVEELDPMIAAVDDEQRGANGRDEQAARRVESGGTV